MWRVGDRVLCTVAASGVIGFCGRVLCTVASSWVNGFFGTVLCTVAPSGVSGFSACGNRVTGFFSAGLGFVPHGPSRLFTS